MKIRRLLALLCVTTFGACGDPLAPGDIPGDGLGFLEIGMFQAGSPSAAVAARGLSFSVAGAAAPLDPASIQSLTVQVTAIQVREVRDEEEDGGEEGPWIDLELEEPVDLDLLALPTEGESPLVIAAGALPAWNYAGVRLFLGSATMVLAEPVSLGQAFTYEAGEPLDVFVPSADQTGIKTDLAFTVGDGEDPAAVNLLFDPTATFTNVQLTGDGKVILAPVIRAHGGNGDEGGS